MRRSGSTFKFGLGALVMALVGALTGCLGNSTSGEGNKGVQTVTLSPSSTQSIDVGATQLFTATGRDANGTVVPGVSIRFVVQSGTPNTSSPLSITAAGNACAGTWDPTGLFCSPGDSGIAIVTAVIEGVSSPPTTVYVHQHIDSIAVSPLTPQGPPRFACFSQGESWNYQAFAFNHGVDITDTVGPMNWSSTNFAVADITTTVPGLSPPLQPNQVQLTAKSPGVTQLFASVSGTNSSPFAYTTCLIQAIYLQVNGQAELGNSVTVNNGGTIAIKATAVDTLFHVANLKSLSSPPLTWSTTNPEVANFSTATNTAGANSATARSNLGGTTLTASCSPPSCNIGVLPALPIYASNGTLPDGSQGFGAISVNVTTTSKPVVYTAYAATTGCQDASGCTSALFAVTPGTAPIGAIVTLPRTPNSLIFNHSTGGRLYIGSDQGLMFVDASAATPTVSLISPSSSPCNVSLCGEVLAISNDGGLVAVADTVSTPSQVYIFNAGSTTASPVDLIIPGQTPIAATFSPDKLKLFILTNTGNMYVYSTVDALNLVPVATTVTDAQFSGDGSFAYVAGTPTGSVSAYSTCAVPGTASVNFGSVATSGPPMRVFPSPVLQADAQGLTQNVLALEPPNVEFLTAKFTQDPILYQNPLQLTCNAPSLLSLTKGSLTNLGQGNFTPIFAQLVGNGSSMVIVGQKIPAVLVFDVTNRTTTAIPLAGSADPLAASSSTDGGQVFVAACDQYDQDGKTCAIGSVHVISTTLQGDIQQVPYSNPNNNNDHNMCNNNGNPAPQCLPDLIAIRPQ